VPFFSDAGWLDLICGYLIKSSLILMFAVALAFILRKKSAGLRHLVLSLFLIGLLFLPLISTLAPGWETGLLPTWRSGNPVPEALERGIDDPMSAKVTWESGRESFSIHSGAESKSQKKENRITGFPANMKSLLGIFVLGAWIMGCVLLFSRLALGLFGAFRLAREGQDMNDSIWKRLLLRFLEAVTLRRRIHLLSHEGVQVPLTWGFIKPVVMMPVESLSWSEGQRSTALFHELSHVKRGDFLVMLLARLSRALYWFNPLSWYVFRQIKKEQEKACDELVLKAGIKPSTYAENLLLIRNSISVSWNPPAAVLGTVGRSHLNERLITILKQRLNLEEVKMKTKILLGMLAVLSITFIGMARPGVPTADDVDPMLHADTVKNVPMAFWTAEPLIQEQEKEQKIKEEQKKQEEKKKAEAKKKKEQGETTYIWTAKKGEKGTIEIIIDEEGEKKTIQLKAPYVLTIKETPDKTYIITSPHIEFKKGEKYVVASPHAELKEGEKVELSGKIKWEKADKVGAVIHVKKHDEKGYEVIEIKAPKVVYTKAVKAPKDVTIKIETEKPLTESVVVVPNVRAHPHVRVHTNVKVDPQVEVVVKKEIYQKQLEKIREIIKNLKEKDLDTTERKKQLERIEEAIQKLNERLVEKSIDIAAHNYRIHTIRPSTEWHQAESDEHGSKSLYFVGKKGNYVVGTAGDKGMYSIYFKDDFKEEHKEAYEKLVQKLREKLPEGYDVESEFAEDKDVFILKITSDEASDKDMDEFTDLIKKLIDELKEDLEKIKK
jgi:beta-lactamase regulating signal transducer with metallopeptidase domain